MARQAKGVPSEIDFQVYPVLVYISKYSHVHKKATDRYWKPGGKAGQSARRWGFVNVECE